MDYLEAQAHTKPARRERLKTPDSQSTAPELSVVTGNLILDTSVAALFCVCVKNIYSFIQIKNTACMNSDKVPHITLHTANLQVPP